jgi:hypothetical protein
MQYVWISETSHTLAPLRQLIRRINWASAEAHKQLVCLPKYDMNMNLAYHIHICLVFVLTIMNMNTIQIELNTSARRPPSGAGSHSWSFEHMLYLKTKTHERFRQVHSEYVHSQQKLFPDMLEVEVEKSSSYLRIRTLSASGARVITEYSWPWENTALRRSSPSFWTLRPWHPLKVVA